MARKILLADDSVTAQNMGRKILADAGYEVVTVNNGSAALKKINEIKPDLIVLDVYMPGYSGLEVCQRLKEGGETARIPVLLTVGKLEPFKPDEAKRVHADGFIVKPFEASELLSALTKLEDRMVPRSEWKPGRFARAIAAVEEGRYAGDEEDTGWKNRISFPPTKKKEREPEPEDADDPAIYNPVNRDLRTVVDHKPAATVPMPPEAETHDKHVDLRAVTPEGLPKDVTEEEIAALAAAAAQLQGKVDEARAAEEKSAENKIADEKAAAIKDAVEHRAAEAKHDAAAESKISETKSDAKVEGTEEKAGAAEPVGLAAAIAAEISAEDRQAATLAFEAPVEATASTAAADAGSQPELSSRELAERGETEPMTMAAAAGAERVAAVTSRWTAVAVAVAPDEAATVLEEEMRKAYAAMAEVEAAKAAAPAAQETAAAEIAATVEPSAVASVSAEITPEALGQTAARVEAEKSREQVEPTPTDATPPADSAAFDAVRRDRVSTDAASTETFLPAAEAATSSTAAGAETEIASPVVRDFEAVAAPTTEGAATPVEAQAVMAPPSESAVAAKSEVGAEPAGTEARAEQTRAPQPAEAVGEEAVAPPAAEGIAVLSAIEPATAASEHETSREHQGEEPVAPVMASEVEEASAISPEKTAAVSEPIAIPEAAAREASVVDESPSEAAATVGNSGEPESVVSAREGTGDMAKKESEMAATTAAAWASWRRIRETGDRATPPAANADTAETASTPEEAMAVAAGAEAASEDSPEIESIVDSVLADLRPKIVEEISRKLKKKK